MKKLYELLLKSKYKSISEYDEKSCSFQKIDGGCEKQVHISKCGNIYVISGSDIVMNTFIHSFKEEFNTCEEVVKYLGL